MGKIYLTIFMIDLITSNFVGGWHWLRSLFFKVCQRIFQKLKYLVALFFISRRVSKALITLHAHWPLEMGLDYLNIKRFVWPLASWRQNLSTRSPLGFQKVSRWFPLIHLLSMGSSERWCKSQVFLAVDRSLWLEWPKSWGEPILNLDERGLTNTLFLLHSYLPLVRVA